jgi:hypothetical protein
MATDDVDDLFAAFWRDAMEAARREPADVIDADASERMSEEDFDSTLW